VDENVDASERLRLERLSYGSRVRDQLRKIAPLAACRSCSRFNLCLDLGGDARDALA
jgi:hypothetical protein